MSSRACVKNALAVSIAALMAASLAPSALAGEEWVPLEGSTYEYEISDYPYSAEASISINGYNGGEEAFAQIPGTIMSEKYDGTPVECDITRFHSGYWTVPVDGGFDFSDCSELERVSVLANSDETPFVVRGLGSGKGLVSLSLGKAVSVPGETLDLSGQKELDSVSITGNEHIKAIDLEGCASLDTLYLGSSRITRLDIPDDVTPTKLSCQYCYIANTEELAKRFGESNVGSQKTFTDEYYRDLDRDAWYMQSCVVPYVSDFGLISGYGNGYFGPHDNVTRGQAATILWRMAGEPIVEAEKFSDVDYGQFYGRAIDWARATGVVSGYGDSNTFDPDGLVSREQLACMIANYAKANGIDVSSDGSSLASLKDAPSIDSWAKDSVSWCVDNGVISGSAQVDGLYMNPFNTAQRCELAKMVTVVDSQIVL